MTYKDKTTAVNVVRMNTNEASKYEVCSERAESSRANYLSEVRVLNKTSLGVYVNSVGLNLERTVLFSDTLHSYRL